MLYSDLKKFWASLFLLCFILIQNVSGKDIHVYPSSNKGIQAAFDSAETGDKIILHKGDYFETLVLINKTDLIIEAAGDGLVRLFGVMKEFYENSFNKWTYLYQENNSFFNNTQWIYEAKIPKSYQEINNKLPDYWHYRNNFYLDEGKMLWSYTDREKFSQRNITGTNGEGVLFEKDKIIIAINQPISEFQSKQYVTYSGQLLRLGNLKNVIFQGGPEKLIEFKYAGRYCINGGGEFDNVIFRNIKITDANDGFYFNQVSGSGIRIEKCEIIKRTLLNAIWEEIKSSKTMEGSGIVYAGGTFESFIINQNYIEGYFNGIVSIPGHLIVENNHLKNIGDDAIELEGPSVYTIVRNNILENCFVSFSLVPIEKGPVYIYNNFVYSNITSYPYQYIDNGKIRYVSPRLIKFWNLSQGIILKDGQLMKVSGNVHFYYNTFISQKSPFTIGNYNKKEFSPVQSSFYNNIFISEDIITNSTGYVEDGIDIDNNVFFSTIMNNSEENLFVGWNGPNHYKEPKNNESWNDNKVIKLYFKNNRGKFKLRCKSFKQLKGFKSREIPDHFPEAEKLNQKKYPGSSRIKL